MTKASLIRTTFNWGWLTGSEVQSIITKGGTWQHPGRHGVGGAKNSVSSSEGLLAGYWLPGSWDEGLKAHTHSDTPTPTGPRLLIVPLPESNICKPSHIPTSVGSPGGTVALNQWQVSL